MSQETFLTAFVEGVQTTAERFIQISQFDKTIQATITGYDTDNDVYYVSSYGCPSFTVVALTSDNEHYFIGDQVYINLPNGDYSSSDKYIIGKLNKVSPKAIAYNKENYLVSNAIQQIDKNNSNKFHYSTLIIEFNAYIKTDIKNGIGVNEILFPFVLSGIDQNTLKFFNKEILWSTNNLYGNIFNKEFAGTQRIIISNLENIKNLELSWDLNLSAAVEIFGLNKKLLGSGTLEINNLNFYLGYSISKLEENSLYSTSIILTEEGERIFYKDDTDGWIMLVNNEDSLALDQLNEIDDSNLWEIQWYDYNLFQENYSPLNQVPQYWDLLEERPKDYKHKLVQLIAHKLTSSTSNSIYSILK